MRARSRSEDEAYSVNVYATDALMAIAGNTAGMFGGSRMTARWQDMVEAKTDTRTPAQIVEDVMKKAGLVFETSETG